MTDHDPDMTVHLPGAAPAAETLQAGELPDDESGNALPMGTRMGEFELLSMIGEGGFGIVYLAQDHSLHRRVAIKEYMPSALAARTQAMTVSVRSRRHAETFDAGLRSFINEARLLAQFDHPSLIKVYRFWEANGTAYMVMPLYTGRTLAATLKALPAPPDEVWLRSLLAPVLDALEVMHRADTFHRDIAPDNIMILADGRPVVLDLGAARRVIGDMTQALTVILKTGYAPIEQYGEMPGVKQGPWTDLYALASVVYFAITGQTPPQSVTRVLTDKYVPLAQAVAGHYSAAFLAAVDACLAVLPQHRPQSIAAFRTRLVAPDDEVTVIRPAVATTIATAAAMPAVSPPPPVRQRPPPAPPMPHPAPVAARSGLWVAAGATLLVGAAGLAYTLSRPAAPPIAPITPVVAVPVPPPPAPAPPVVVTPPPPPAPAAAASTVTPAVATAPLPRPVVVPEPKPAPTPKPAPRPPVAQNDTPRSKPAPTPPATTTPDPDTRPPLSPQGVPEPPVWTSNGKTPKVVKVNPPAPDYVTQVKCNDLLQRQALGDPVSEGDKAFVRRHCH